MKAVLVLRVDHCDEPMGVSAPMWGSARASEEVLAHSIVHASQHAHSICAALVGNGSARKSKGVLGFIRDSFDI